MSEIEDLKEFVAANGGAQFDSLDGAAAFMLRNLEDPSFVSLCVVSVEQEAAVVSIDPTTARALAETLVRLADEAEGKRDE